MVNTEIFNTDNRYEGVSTPEISVSSENIKPNSESVTDPVTPIEIIPLEEVKADDTAIFSANIGFPRNPVSQDGLSIDSGDLWSEAGEKKSKGFSLEDVQRNVA